MKAKLARPMTLVRLPRIIETISPHVKSSLTYTQMIALARFAKDVPSANILAATLPGEMGPSSVKPNMAAAQALVRKMFY